MDCVYKKQRSFGRSIDADTHGQCDQMLEEKVAQFSPKVA